MNLFLNSSNAGIAAVMNDAAPRLRFALQRGMVLLAFLCLLGPRTVDAFPPAPYYTLYGAVRDQVGQTVTAEGAEVILLKGGVEVGRTPITSSLIDRNYELNMRLDQARSGTTFYTDKATPISSPSGPSQWLFQGPPAESKFLAAERSVVSDDRPAGVGQWQNLAFEHRAIFTSKNLSDLAPASNPLFPLPVRLPSIFSSSGEEENYLH